MTLNHLQMHQSKLKNRCDSISQTNFHFRMLDSSQASQGDIRDLIFMPSCKPNSVQNVGMTRHKNISDVEQHRIKTERKKNGMKNCLVMRKQR